MIPNEVTVLCWSEPQGEDLNFAKLASFLGVKSRLLRIDAESACAGYFEQNLSRKPICLAASGKTLARIFSSCNFDPELRSFILHEVSHLLVYANEPNQSCSDALSHLTEGAIASIAPLREPDTKYEISQNHRGICRQLTGLAFEGANKLTDVTFASDGGQNSLNSLVKIGDREFFAALQRKKCNIFIAGCSSVADIDTHVSPASEVRSYFSQLIPAMMFLKHVFKESAWHAQKPFANFMVDDPLLQQRYGFLDYRKLLHAMDSAGFSTTIAFIPWNFKRTDSATAALLRSRPDRFSIVVHGCDHTASEFNSNDAGLLSRKTREALRRMHSHQKITGLPFERVMIFPQGRFSIAAMKALKANNFLAAVNTSPVPVDDSETILLLRDLLDVAILNYESFPLFVRRYPVNIFDCALDLFLGKPLLLAEHHGYFRNGYDEIAGFASRVNALDENLTWHGLGHVLHHAGLRKRGLGVDLHMKLYANAACIVGEPEQETTCRISKADSDNLRVQAMTLSGTPVKFVRSGDALTLSLHLAKGARARLEIDFENPWNQADFQYRLAEPFKVFVRRHLSEIRDNYIARSESVLSLAYRVKGFLARPQH